MNQDRWLVLTILPAFVAAGLGLILGKKSLAESKVSRPRPGIFLGHTQNGAKGLQNGAFKARLNGIEISYTIAGRGPTLFVQGVGWGPNSRFYQQTLKFLERQLTLVYIDPRGTGETEPLPDTTILSSDRMADDLEALRAHLGINRIALLGHAHGGFIAMKYALKYPKRLSHLILVSSIMLRDLEADTRAINENLERHPRRKDAAWQEALARFKNEYDARTSEALRENMLATSILYFYSFGSKPRASFESAVKDTKFSVANFDQFVQRELLHYNLDGQEKGITAPTLLIYGMYDPYYLRSTIRELHWQIANSKFELFERSGHYPWIEEPEHFAQIMQAFLNPPLASVKDGDR